MTVTKTNTTTLIPRGTTIASGAYYGGACSVASAYGGQMDLLLTNGGTGPTTQAQVQVLASSDTTQAVTGASGTSSVTVTCADTRGAAVGDWVYIQGITGITNCNGFFRLTAVSANTSITFSPYSAASGSYSSGGTIVFGFLPVSTPLGAGTTASYVNGGAATSDPGRVPWSVYVDVSCYSYVGVAAGGNTGQSVTAWAKWCEVDG